MRNKIISLVNEIKFDHLSQKTPNNTLTPKINDDVSISEITSTPAD